MKDSKASIYSRVLGRVLLNPKPPKPRKDPEKLGQGSVLHVSRFVVVVELQEHAARHLRGSCQGT